MRSVPVIVALVFGLMPYVLAQTVTADFTILSSACKQQTLPIQNQSSNADQYEWDFCLRDSYQLQGVTDNTVSGLGAGYGYKLVENNGLWYGFAVSQANSSIFRLDFGNNPGNVPTITSLGNPGSLLSFPQGIEIVKSNGKWYGFVGFNDINHGIVRLDFDTQLTNTPTAQNIGTFGLAARFWDLRVVEEDSNLILVCANYNSNSVARINFRDSFDNPITPAHVFSTGGLTGSNFVTGLDIVKAGSEWVVLVASYVNDKILQVNFSNGLLNSHTVKAAYSFTGVVRPYRVKIIREGSNYFAVVSNEAQRIQMIDFKDMTIANPPVEVSHPTLVTLLGLDAVRYKGKSIVHGIGGNIVKNYTFSSSCSANVAYSESANPAPVVYTSSGTYEIELKAIDSNAKQIAVKSQAVTISMLTSPDIDFVYENICVNADVNFSPVNPAPDLVYDWDFGDLTPPSSNRNPTHQFTTAGLFNTTLQVTAPDGCKNTVCKTLKLYNQPVSSFNLPAGLLCTNNEFTFINTTTDNFDGNLSFQWFVDGNPVSNVKDLQFTFDTGGQKNVTLRSSIRGCFNEVTQQTSSIGEGLAVDFDIIGRCEESLIEFRGTTSEAPASILWDFGDASTSSNLLADHTYTSEGTFEVNLSVSANNGCVTTKSKAIEIEDKPKPDFLSEGPPSSCSGSVTHFIDISDPVVGGEIVAWNWRFNNETANTKNPTYQFQNAGEYDVEFTVTTDAGCSNSIVKPIVILQSPVVSFTNGPLCLDVPASFTASGNEGVNYYWEIGTSYYEAKNVTHIFSTPGNHVVKLDVMGSNDCVSKITKSVNVPQPVNPLFGYTNNCKGYQTRFSAEFNSADPVVTQNWNFASEGVSADAAPSFAFNTLGTKLVTLKVTTASGCIYQHQSSVNVIEPPLAGFTFSPSFGVPPQEISFNNTSTNATTFKWDFDNGASSSEASPKHTFTELGDFNVSLKASNQAGCETSTSKTISMVAPLPDVDLDLMTITPNNDGTSKVIITIANNGNTFLRNLPVSLDVSGDVTLQTIVQESIAPFSKYNLVLNFGIAQSQTLEFLCASATLEGDLNPQGNRICNQLKTETAILSPYPNPAKDFLIVEWVAPEGEQVKVDLVGSDGKTSVNFTETSLPGLNQKTLDISRIRSGIYILRIVSPSRSKMHRIFVSGQN